MDLRSRVCLFLGCLSMILIVTESKRDCTINRDCPGREICCGRHCSRKFSCVKCHRHSDCPGRAMCCFGKCSLRSTPCESFRTCHRHSSCPGEERCCRQKCVRKDSCNDFCLEDTHCKVYQFCRLNNNETDYKEHHINLCAPRRCNVTSDCTMFSGQNKKIRRRIKVNCKHGICHRKHRKIRSKGTAILEVAKMVLFVLLAIFGAYCFVGCIRKCVKELYSDPENFCQNIGKNLTKSVTGIVTALLCFPKCIWNCLTAASSADSDTSSVQGSEHETEMTQSYINPAVATQTEDDNISNLSLVFQPTVTYAEQFPVAFDADFGTNVTRSANSTKPDHQSSVTDNDEGEAPPPSYEDVMSRGPPPLYEDVVT